MKRLCGRGPAIRKPGPADREPPAEKKRPGNGRQAMREECRVTFEALRRKMLRIQKRTGLPDGPAMSRAEAI